MTTLAGMPSWDCSVGSADGTVCLPLFRIVYTAQNLVIRYTLSTSDLFV